MSDRLGNDPEVEPLIEEVRSADVPVLSARRLPEFLTVPISNERLAEELEEVYSDTIAVTNLTCMTVFDGDEPLFERQGNQPYTPASTQKIQTAVAALLRLGADYTFTTEVRAVEAPVDGAVNHLYLVGGGDPLLMTTEYASSFDRLSPALYTNIDELADAVIAAGITRIDGGIRSVSSRYDDQRYPEGWPERFGTQGQSGPLSSLMINDSFTSWPATDADREFAEQLGIATTSSPGVHAAAFFDDLLEARDLVPARGQSEIDPSVDPDDLVLVASITSPPLHRIVTQMLQFSDNTTAELLTKELGVAQTGVGSTAAGTAAMAVILTEAGLPGFELPARDGSGLDSGNKLSCMQLNSLLQHPDTREIIEAAMPVAAETGTLADRFRSTSAAGNLRAKTGSLRNVTALAGYVDSSKGDTLTFAYIAMNGADSELPAGFKNVQEPIGDSLAEYPTGPPIDSIAPPGEAELPGASLSFESDDADDENPDDESSTTDGDTGADTDSDTGGG